MIPFWASAIIQAILETATAEEPKTNTLMNIEPTQEQQAAGYPPLFPKGHKPRKQALLTMQNECDNPSVFNKTVDKTGNDNVQQVSLSYVYKDTECFVKADFSMADGSKQTFWQTTGKGKSVPQQYWMPGYEGQQLNDHQNIQGSWKNPTDNQSKQSVPGY